MKKIILLFTAILLFGCDSDDNSNDRIVGKWAITSYYWLDENGEIDFDSKENKQDCLNKLDLQIKSNNTATQNTYVHDDELSSCQLHNTFNFNWNKISEDMYYLFYQETPTRIIFIDDNMIIYGIDIAVVHKRI